MRRLMLVAMLALATGAAPATQPADATASLEVRAATAFSNGQYALALPLLQRLAENYQGKPDKLGPVEEQIRVCQAQIAQFGGIAPSAPTAEKGPRKPHVKPKEGDVLEVTIQNLGNFEYDSDKGGNIPRDVIELSGSTVRLNGFMIPIDQAENITQFALVPDLFACCYGQPPQLQHTVVCKAPAGKAIGYYPDELIVEGKLNVEEKKDEGFIISVFELDVTSVKPATK